jgi:F0F1-type ATP synthase membrane subunit b/b'
MKLKTTLTVILSVGLSPTLAFCAEGTAEGGGSWAALLFYIINFAIFAYILARYGGPLAVKFFRDRAHEIRENIELTERGFRSATQTAQSAEAEIAGLEAEKVRILTQMRQETVREVARMRELGRTAAERIRRDGEMTGRAIAEGGRRTIQAHLAATAVRLARDIIANNFEPDDQARLVQEFLETVRQEARS